MFWGEIFLDIGKLSQYNVQEVGRVGYYCLFIFTETNSVKKYTNMLKIGYLGIVDLWAILISYSSLYFLTFYNFLLHSY